MIDITRLSPAELDRFIHLQVTVDRQQAAQDKVKSLRDYYYGEHPVLLTQRQSEYLGPMVTGDAFTFAHNLVKTVVDTLRERLMVTGFTVNGASADDLDQTEDPSTEAHLAGLLWRWWNANRMDSQQIRLYRRTLRDGRSFVIVDYDAQNGHPRLNLHKTDDGTTGITYHRDPTDTNRVLYACRYFYSYDPLKPGQTGQERKTVYLPDQIRKYIKRGGGDWEPYAEEDDGNWPLPWRAVDGAPLGVPVFEFENPGGSEIEQIIGLQNALNKSWLDLIAAADTSGFPLIAVEYELPQAGVQPEDDTGLVGEDEFRLSPARAIEVDQARVHRLEAANLEPMISTVWALVTAIAGVSRTPQYYLRPMGGAEVPSGESLKQLESGIVKRAEERQLMFGQAWADVMAMCIHVEAAFGTEAIPELDDLDIATHWADANVRNELVQGQTAEIHKRLEVPNEQVWALLGYEPEEIAQFKENSRLERAAEVASIADSLRLAQVRSAPQTNPETFAQNGQNGGNNGSQ